MHDYCEAAVGKDRKILIPYLVAGDPDLDTTLALMHSLVEQGADVIELGFPFSDPSSDGPVIQRGVERALKAGTRLTDVFNLVAQFRRDNDQIPVVLMGYLNPIEIMGYEHFAERARTAGIDGVLIVDLPPSESSDLHASLRNADIDTLYLVAPTTGPKRAADIIAHTSGYLYYVSLKGVTGAALIDQEAIAGKIAELRSMTTLPIVIGFGIKDADSAAAMARFADGVVIGSALVDRIADLSPGADADAVTATTALIGLARDALDTLK